MLYPVGTQVPKLVVPEMQRAMIVRYAGASGDFNPIHYDDDVAQSAGFPSVFSQGMLQAALLATCATNWLGTCGVRRFKVRFANQVWPGDAVTCGGEVIEVGRVRGATTIRLALVASRHNGDVVATAEAEFEVPDQSRLEKE